MDFAALLSFTSTSPTTVPAIASRPFTTAFVLTCFGRLIYEAQIGTIGPWVTVGGVPLAEVQGMSLPFWLISEVMLVLFGLLTVAEWYSDYNEDARALLEDAKTNFVKPGVAGMLQFGLVQGQAATVLELMAQHLPAGTLAWLYSVSPGVAMASLGPAETMQVAALGWVVTLVAGVWAALMAGLTWIVAGLRQGAVELIGELDADDSLGLMKLFSLAEGGWTVTLMVILVFLPVLALALAGLTVLGLFVVRKWFEQRDERSKVGCASCGNRMYPTALFCPACRQANHAPRAVGVFGQARAVEATDRTAHRLNLIARKRCPTCATHLSARAIRQTCTTCGTTTFGDVSEANVYLRTLDKKLPQTLVLCGLLGFVPVLGLVPGIIYYRLSLIASLRAYIPRTTGCLTRWALRFATLLLIGLQPFMLGWLTLPAMALLNYYVYRAVFAAGFNSFATGPASQGGVPLTGAVALAGGPAMALPAPAVAYISPPLAEAEPTPSSTAAATPGVCGACGTQSALNHRFCVTCGRPLAA